ncbi:MAG: hypothetical protein CSA62_09885 [Planctomycetota bacterium]|nr:MAG: hypothetical protein CSA62_09885 [Planctomycetota bacterium]
MVKSKQKPSRGKPKKRSPLGRVISLMVLLAASYIVLSAGICWVLIRPNSHGLLLEPRTRGVSVGEVEFQTADGVTLRGWHSEARDKPIILLAHGRDSHRGQWRDLYVSLFLKHGLGFLCFDFRGSGLSDGATSTGGIKETLDLQAALDWLIETKGYKKDRIALVASDMAAVAAMQIPERIDELGCVIFVAPSETPKRRLQRTLRGYHLPLRPTASLALFGAHLITKSSLDFPALADNFGSLHFAPIHFLVGEKDSVAPPELVTGWLQLVPNSEKSIEILPEMDHDDMMDPENRELTPKIISLLKKHLDY